MAIRPMVSGIACLVWIGCGDGAPTSPPAATTTGGRGTPGSTSAGTTSAGGTEGGGGAGGRGGLGGSGGADGSGGSGGEPLPEGPCPSVPPGFQRVVQVSATSNNGTPLGAGSTYEAAFGPWPLAGDNGSSTFNFDLDHDAFVALPFDVSPDAGSPTFVLFTWVLPVIQPSGTLVSVSSFRGAFASEDAVPQPPGSTCFVQGGNAGGSLSVGTTGSGADCELPPGSYYLNVAHWDSVAEEASCPPGNPGYCQWKVQPVALCDGESCP